MSRATGINCFIYWYGQGLFTRSALPALLPRATILAEREVRRMDYTNAMMVWDAVSVRITDVRHGTIAGGQSELTGENGLFIFVSSCFVQTSVYLSSFE